jgi:IS605 OrfB family transposase
MKEKYNSSPEFNKFLPKLRKQYTSIFHYAYNRLYDGKSKLEIYHLCKLLNNIELIKSKMIEYTIDDAYDCYDKFRDKRITFGSKLLFKRKCKGLITNEEWKEKRLKRLYTQGETFKYGNRYFDLDFYNNQIIFKYDRNNYYILDVKPSKNQLKELIKLQELCENKQSKYTISLGENDICISFEEIKSEEKINYIENRFIGIDLNPSCIGISILEYKDKLEILKTYSFDFKNITDKILRENKNLNNKLNYEILEISKRISNISKQFKCKFIFIEDLEFKDYTKYNNRLLNNLWKRNMFIDNLQKRCNINNQKLFKVNPAYTSFIGNCMYDYVDPINASIEIGRRGFECIILKNKKFYPTFYLKESLKHQWKETVNDIINNWRELFNLIKNSKLSYRISLNECNYSFDVFRKKSRMVDYYQFL